MREKIIKRGVKSPKDSQFSKWLKAELKVRNITQAELGRATGRNPTTVNRLLRSVKMPIPSTVNSIADFLHLPREELYRIAGYLPPLSREDTHLERVKSKYSLLSPEKQAKFERLLDFELMEQRHGNASQK